MRAFHGRAAELELLHTALRGTAAPVRRSCCSADAGVGKTRLVAEFGRAAAGEGAVVLTGGR
ncbi:ATP-binding protein [Pseudonocardia sp. MCCB 268]|nr:ATP-binding protein [Pseudonocardia cytotoxica]